MDAPHYLVTAEVVLDALTPVMRQVIDAKQRHPDALILFRLGDFYELFFEDALDGARLLDLTLTSRNKNDPRPIPMCGFPYHQMHNYVQKALEAGRRCAIVEQLEEPGATKGIVQRGVTHVMTPGVMLEPEALDVRRSNRVVALAPGRHGGLGVAMADVSTGECGVAEVQHPLALSVLLVRLEPRELVLPAAAEAWLDGVASARDLLRTVREAPGREEAPIDAALALLGAYLAEVRPGSQALLDKPEPLAATPHLQLNREAVTHLELLQTARHGRRQGSLLHAVDRTCTGAGARLLRALLLAPLADRKALEVRHAAVQTLLDDRPARDGIRGLLRHHGDLARIATRAAAGLSMPRELAALRDTLVTLPELREIAGRLSAVASVEPRRCTRS
jgi:DNA mismatch repair protein MutS